ncbi:MAG: hypothetical protein P4N60_09795 [Verrucomicrobiae bacterium]|nr:hypothetical protein [Verrucomicrobiae bacterium]
MKPHIKVIILFVAGSLWFLLLSFIDWMLRDKWQGGGLPSPWGEIAAVMVTLGPPFIAGLFVFRHSYPLDAIHGAGRWLLYFAGSATVGVGACFTGGLLRYAFGLR